LDSNSQGVRDVISPISNQNDNGTYFSINSSSNVVNASGGNSISSIDKNNTGSTSSSSNTSTTTSASENLYDEYKRRLELIKKINPIK
jgi:hypothetical protein